MGKPKIYSTGNDVLKGEFNISYYIVEKEASFLDWLGKLLIEVFEIEDGENHAKFIVEDVRNDEDKIIDTKIYVKNVEKMVDVHEKYFSMGMNHPYNKQSRLDVFYGKERIFLTLRTPRKNWKKFSSFVRKTKDWVKVKESDREKIPLYVTEKNKR